MKRRDLLVLWLDYFNSRVGRRKGRRVPLSLAARSPTLEDLRRAAEAAGLQVVAAKVARRPDAQFPTGYVQVRKVEGRSKQAVIREVAIHLSRIRGERA